MNILHLIKSLGRGGAEMLLPETIKLHHSKQFNFHVIYFLPWKNQLVATIESTGVKVTCLSANNNIQLMLQAPKLLQYIREHNIDLIHCHLPWAGFLGRYVHARTGIPMLYTEHNKQERYHGITKQLNQWTFNFQSAAIAVSGDVAESIEKNIHPRIPVHVVLNGVNTNNFRRNTEAAMAIKKQYGIHDNSFVVGTMAVFRFQKRLEIWLEVVAELYKKYPTLRAVMVGDGPLKAELENTIAKLGLQDVIIRPGLQTNTIDWFSTMDVFMMSSSFEGLPIALLEAMSCNCAIVSTNAGGIGEVIRHDIDGLLCGVDEWQQLVPLTERLINDRQQLQRLSAAARQRAEQAFSLQRMVNELETIYTSFDIKK